MKCVNCGHAVRIIPPSERENRRKIEHNIRHSGRRIKCRCGCRDPIMEEEKGYFTRRELSNRVRKSD